MGSKLLPDPEVCNHGKRPKIRNLLGLTTYAIENARSHDLSICF